MKVVDILNSDTRNTLEENVINCLKTFDWKYEYSDNVSRIKRGEKALTVLENNVYQLWKQNPDMAVKLWNNFCPEYISNPNVVPSFLLRMQSRETL